MTCVVCGGKMIQRAEYVQVKGQHQLSTRDFWWCPLCKTRSAGWFIHEEAAPPRVEVRMR